MRAITVRQPWAWAIIHGGKDVENRTRNIAGAYRGPVAIHAGLAFDEHMPRDLAPEIVELFTARRHYPRGAIIGVVDLVDIHECRSHRGDSDVPDCVRSGTPLATTCSSWAEFRRGETVHHLVLANPRPLVEPIPWRGQLGLWTLPDDVLEVAA